MSNTTQSERNRAFRDKWFKGKNPVFLSCGDTEHMSLSEIKTAAYYDLEMMKNADCPRDYSFYQEMSRLRELINEIWEMPFSEMSEAEANQLVEILANQATLARAVKELPYVDARKKAISKLNDEKLLLEIIGGSEADFLTTHTYVYTIEEYEEITDYHGDTVGGNVAKTYKLNQPLDFRKVAEQRLADLREANQTKGGSGVDFIDLIIKENKTVSEQKRAAIRELEAMNNIPKDVPFDHSMIQRAQRLQAFISHLTKLEETEENNENENLLDTEVEHYG